MILFIALVMTATMLLNGIPVREIGYGMLLCILLLLRQQSLDSADIVKVVSAE